MLACTELIGSKFILLSDCLSKSTFDFVMLGILSARDISFVPSMYVIVKK